MRMIPMLLMVWLAAATTSVSGEWAVSAAFDATSVAKGMPPRAGLVCYLKQEQDALTGDCRPANGPGGVPVAGTVRGDRVEWRFEIALGPNMKKQTITFRSTVNRSGTRMKGTFSIANRRGTFTAKRQ
jgi:hypothetical protein